MTNFAIHAKLLADCHRLGRLALCHVLLHKNAAVPWFILVPEVESADLLGLPQEQRNSALAEAALVARFITHDLDWAKINFAAIGNIVPQLHLHVVGRKSGDACWPAPVWGRLADGPEYSAARVGEIAQALRRRCALQIL